MTTRPADDIAEKLRVSLEAGLSEDAMKAIKKHAESIIDDIETDVMYRLKDDLAYNLAGFVQDMAERTVNAILEGNDDEMRRYLSAREGRWTGRNGDHPVIHGKLFETGAIALRKKIAQAHRDIIGSERILDLEDQVQSLVDQVNKIKREKDELWERVR